MERRTALAFFIILAAYFLLFAGRGAPPQTPGEDSLAAVIPDSLGTAALDPLPTELPAEDTSQVPTTVWEGAPAVGDTTVYTLGNERVGMTFANPGGMLRELDLREYKDLTREHVLDLVPDVQRSRAALGMELTIDGVVVPLHVQPWKIEAVDDSTLVMQTRLEDRLHITKYIRLGAGRYGADVELSIENLSAEPLNIDYTIFGPSAMVEETSARGSGVTGTYGRVYDGGADAELLERATVQDEETREHQVPEVASFVGLASAHFIAALAPRGERPFAVKFWAGPRELDNAQAKPGEVLEVQLHSGLVYKNVSLPGAAKIRSDFELIGVPKSEEALEHYADIGLPELRDLGWFGAIGTLFLSALDLLFGVTGNYGWAIILLTVMIRLVMHPLSRFSQKNMQKMQLLAPKVEEIKKKYEGKSSREAKAAMNQEVMALYQSHGANPMLGCLPMFLQIPIFIGLYQAILVSEKLRQQVWLSVGDWTWPGDLSLPDTLFVLPFQLPWPLETYAFNLLPIVVMVIMLVQQTMSPKPKDPTQATTQKMMKFFMLFLCVMFYNLPSGLLLYWGTSSLIGLGESFFVKRALAQSSEGAAAEAATAAPTESGPLVPEKVPPSPKKKKKKKKKRR